MSAITIEFLDGLRVSRGKLLSARTGGSSVHAATFLREGRIVLDAALLKRPRELKRIFVHELFHFVWWRFGNPRRLAWERLLIHEFSRGARGELGWSAEWRKKNLCATDRQRRTRRWREYCCESFCDTGASQFLGSRWYSENTLAPGFRAVRAKWLGDIIRSEEDLVHCINREMRWNSGAKPPGVLRLFPLRVGQRAISQGIERPQAGA